MFRFIKTCLITVEKISDETWLNTNKVTLAKNSVFCPNGIEWYILIFDKNDYLEIFYP